MHEHHVGILGTGLVESIEDGAGIADVLAAGDGDEGSLGQVRLGLAILARAQEVPCVDGGGGQRPGSAGVRTVARSPRGQVAIS